MVSRPRPCLGTTRRLTGSFVLAGLCLTISTGPLRAQAPLNQPAPTDPTAWFDTLLGNITGKDQGESNRRTRFVVELDKQAPYNIRTLDNPRRVVVELPKIAFRLPRVPAAGLGLIKRIRAGATSPGRTSIIVDVTDPVVVEHSTVNPAPGGRSARLEVVIAPLKPAKKTAQFDTSGFSRLGATVLQPPVPQPANSAAPKRPAGYKPLIVLDPGHGGQDSGAQKFGVSEKDVVLAFSRVFRDYLRKSGRYRVAMTRDKDEFISLSDRREFAEQKRAALFIAVHADYANSRARGATIYSLRKRVATRLRHAAAKGISKEVMSDRVMRYVSAKSEDLGAVQGILGDLAQREVEVNLERTNVFTRIAVAQMGSATTMRSEPHREAAFAVLKTAKVPSVLIELAYVSNRRDAARLKSRRWRHQVARSLMTAVDKYFSHSLSQIPH